MAAPIQLNEEQCKDYQEQFLQFLETFEVGAESASQVTEDGRQDRTKPYIDELRRMVANDKTTIFVSLEHLNDYDMELSDTIQLFNHRLDPYLRKAVQNFVKKHEPAHTDETAHAVDKEFYVGFYDIPNTRKLRDLKTGLIGQLTSFSGTVTRTSEVRPELFLGTFRCLECQAIIHDVEQQFKYTPPLICTNTTCGNRKMWLLERDLSKFVDWQRVKVQECSDEVPAGSLPRTIEVIMRNDTVETARAGDKMVFCGNLIAVPDVAAISAPGERVQASSGRPQGNSGGEGVTGLKYLGVRELTYKLSFLASAAQTADEQSGMVNIRADEASTPEMVFNEFTPEQQEEILMMKADPNIYHNLAKSIAPGVYGHEDIKRAVLLMLLGGVHKQTKEGINLRGDINVAIVGDPSCAKSQMLKYVAKFLPRAVYTSGKSSSAAGLTATVVKESDSNEFCIEAGALMLADNGICCIDEFDKMDVKDQVAIHEAMEQQTISIAKAGIQATLNARTSILAAANPVGGRYDRSKPLKYNVALPPAILSRFDLMHIMIDEPDDVLDYSVAHHIVSVHQKKDRAFEVPYEMSQMQRYIKYARSIKPQLSPEAAKVMVESYKRLRSEDAAPGSQTAYRITVRQLEALVRLSEALARLRCNNIIRPSYVKEACRLVKNSIIAVESPDVEVDADEFVEEEVDEMMAEAEAARQAAQQQGEEMAAAEDDEGSADENVNVANMDIDAQRARREGAKAAAKPPQQPPSAPERGATAQPPVKKEVAKVSKKKFVQVQNILTLKLRELEEREEGAALPHGTAEVYAISQHDLIKWYFDHITSRQALSPADLKTELVLVEKIVQHLIKKEGIITVVETPEKGADEAHEDYQRRVQSERLLALNPNYAAE